MADIVNPLSPMEMQVQQQSIDRQRKIAEYLQQQSLTPDQGQMVSGRFVAPDKMQYIARLAQGLLGRTQQDSLDDKQKQIATQQGDAERYQFGIGGTSAQSSSPSATQSPAQEPPSMPLGSGMSGIGTNNIVGNDKIAAMLLNQPVESPQAQSSPLYGSRVIPGMDKNIALQTYYRDPKAYDAAFLKQFDPTEMQRNDKYLGITADQSKQSELAKRAASGAVVNRGFGILTTNPVTGKLENDPASMQGIEQAKAIEGRYAAPVKLDLPGGQSIQLSPTEYAEFQKNGGRLPTRFLPQEMQDALQKDVNSSGQPADVNVKVPQGTVSGRIAPNSQPQSAGMPSGSIGIGQSTASHAEQEVYGKNLAGYQKDIDEHAIAAQTVKARIGELREASQGFTGGALTPYKEKIGGIMMALGADPDTVTAKIGNVSNMQSFNKEALNLAFDMTKQLTSRPAASEVMLALKANPNLALQPDASKRIMDTIEGMADYQLAKQQSSSEWRAAHNGSIDGFESDWNKNQPIKKYIDFAALNSPTPKGGTPSGPGAIPLIPVVKGGPVRPPLDSLIKVR